MKTVVAFCAVLTFAACGPAASAPAHSNFANPFNESALRPPGSIPHVSGTRAAATAPLPRPKPMAAPRRAPPAAPGRPLAFPPVATLE